MNFSLWLESKYLRYGSMTCIECSNPLFPFKIKINPKHIYNIGQSFQCQCGVAKCWTNSVRNPKSLLNHFETNEPYRSGFCNDMFCTYCAKYLQPLQNGYEFNGKRTDLYGCTTCEQNRMVLGRDRIPEGGEAELETWYRKKLPEFKQAVQQHT